MRSLRSKWIAQVVVILAALFLISPSAFSKGKGEKETLSGWLNNLGKRITRLEKKTSIRPVTTVAGVRGAKEKKAAHKPYWKGKKRVKEVSAKEIKQFKIGLSYAQKGEKEEAIKEFEKFIKLYPQSELTKEAKKAIELLKAEIPSPRSE